jgi:integrase
MVAKPERVKETEAWTAEDVDRFLDASGSHRWALAFRLGVLYGLRRSEILALRWDDLDTKAGTLRIDESLVATRTGAAWSNAKNERSRPIIPLDDETLREFARRRAAHAVEQQRRSDTRRTGTLQRVSWAAVADPASRSRLRSSHSSRPIPGDCDRARASLSSDE